ncbi:MAG: cysteine-rich CWC family protein [Bacteroidales bacterium]|nr:cysteine-rich CWC family protein [Bacteroidales bacterium]
MKKICPVCGKSFVCRSHDIPNCDCLTVHLSSRARVYLHVHYPDECLCVDCLKSMNQKVDRQE